MLYEYNQMSLFEIADQISDQETLDSSQAMQENKSLQEIIKLKDQLHEARVESQTLKQELQFAHRDLAQKYKKIQSLAEQNVRLEEKTQSLLQKNRKLVDQNERLQEKTQSLLWKNKQLKKQNEILEEKTQSLLWKNQSFDKQSQSLSEENLSNREFSDNKKKSLNYKSQRETGVSIIYQLGADKGKQFGRKKSTVYQKIQNQIEYGEDLNRLLKNKMKLQ